MTKQEIAELTKRIAAKMERGGLASRPLSEAQKERAARILRHVRETEEQEMRLRDVVRA